MGGIEVSRDGGAHQETVKVLFEETILSHSSGDNMPVCIIEKSSMCVHT